MASSRVLLSVLFSAALGAAASSRTLCGQYDSHVSSSSPYIFSTNAWGDDGSGGQCVTIPSDDKSFSATWKWTSNPDSVHAFPNIKLESDLFPIQLQNLSALNLAVTWSMAPEDTSSGDLTSIGASADVVADMFLDADAKKSNSTTLPKYEVMVWMGRYGGANPIGYNASVSGLPTFDLDGTTFTLYSGPNGIGQFVYSWVAPSNITTFNKDIAPLLHYLADKKLITNTTYLGGMQYGTESFHATSNVTFAAKDFSIKVEKGNGTTTTTSSTGKKSMASGGKQSSLALVFLSGVMGVMALL